MWWTIGGVLGFLGVALGAFGAHGLKNVVDDQVLLDAWDTGARYHLVHALAVLVGTMNPHVHVAARVLFVMGILLFSGSLYAMALTGMRSVFGPITPLGGLCFLAGWLVLAWTGRGWIPG